MMSALEGGRGSPKSRQKERGCVNSVHDKGGWGKKIRNFCGCHIWKPPYSDLLSRSPQIKLVSKVIEYTFYLSLKRLEHDS